MKRYTEIIPQLVSAAEREPWPRGPAARERWLYYNVYTVPWRSFELLDVINDYTGGRGVVGARVLDLGCGFGAMGLSMLLDGGAHQVIGVDLQERPLRSLMGAVRDARVKGLSVGIAHAQRLPFAPESFDVVISYDVLYQRGMNRAAILGRMRSLLVPSGVLAIKLVNRAFPPYALLAAPGIRDVADRLFAGLPRFRSFIQPGAPTGRSLRDEMLRAGLGDVAIYNRYTRRAHGRTRWFLPDVFACARRPQASNVPDDVGSRAISESSRR